MTWICGCDGVHRLKKLEEKGMGDRDWTTVATTVVPALGDPRREQPPAVYGHFVNVPTHFNVKLPVISGHLPNADADSHLLVVQHLL